MSEVIVSIVCTNYNKGSWIGDAVESFLKQETDFEYEILLIDDDSTDESKDIIKRYSKQHHGKIRAFYNKKNLGITKTWTKVCKQAKGKYIARCDGDDYWTDNRKLQKQVDLLEKSKDSRWCSTDYDIITPEGEVAHKSAFESGLVDRSASYAQMLATRGFTMSSTWLVDTKLMQEVNAEIDQSAVDDTFNIQLDLFNKTKLSYIPEATVVYRINDGSDSRPVEMDKIKSRSDRLLKTQLEYIGKYKNVDYEEIINILLPRSSNCELLAIDRLQLILQLRKDVVNLERTIKEQNDFIYEILHSKRYKLGGYLAQPLSLVRSLKGFFVRTSEDGEGK